MVFQEHANENQEYIPNDANFVVRIDGRKLLNTSASSIILHEDEEIINLIERLLQDEMEGESTIKGLGIAINSDIIVFSQSKNDHELVGVLFNLIRPKTFKKNAPLLFGDNQAIATSGNVGLVYMEINNEKGNKLAAKTLKKKADKLLSIKSNFDFSIFKPSEDNVMAQSWSKKGLIKEINIAHNASLSFIITDTELIIDGELAYNLESKSEISKDIKPHGIHLSMDQVSGIINDSLVSLFKNLNIPEGKISGLSVNYHELELIADPVLFPAPKFDALVTFESNFDIESAIDSLLSKEDSKRINESCISYSGLKLYYEQVDNKTVYIGTSKNVSYIMHDNKTSFRMHGDPACFTKIEGSGMMKSLVEMMPYFTNSREFLGKIETLDISVGTPKNGISKVHASIKFDKGKYPLNSILMFMIESN
ncbi:MAG: hypothetical protein ACJA1C_000843 [Crocinitomicaceae bacterium]|jgi:hypothetical protein